MTAKGIEPDEHGRFSVTADAERARNHFSGRGVIAERRAEAEVVV
jgi:hypothetical protein